MAENENKQDVMDKDQKVTEPPKNNEPDNEPENAQDSQKETLTVFKKAKKSKKVKTGIIVTLAGIAGFFIGRLTGKSNEPTEEVIDVEPEEEETAE